MAGIYFFDRIKHRLTRHRDRFVDDNDGDEVADFNMKPRPDSDDSDDYRDALNELNHAITQDLGETRRGQADTPAADDEAETTASQPTAQSGWTQDGEALAEAEIGVSNDETTEQSPGEPERLVIFYLKAPEGQAFAGPALFEALAATGLTLGEMGIYHDTDSSGQTVFSVANIFEPGTLDIEDVDNFTTRGVALFMQLPLMTRNMDEQDAFERMLGKTEILSERLGGELHDESHQPLDEAGVARARSILKPA